MAGAETDTWQERANAHIEDPLNYSITAVEKLREDIGIPTRLRDIGVTEDVRFVMKGGRVFHLEGATTN